MTYDHAGRDRRRHGPGLRDSAEAAGCLAGSERGRSRRHPAGRRPRQLGVATLVLLAGLAWAAEPGLGAFLRQRAGFSGEDLARFEAGEAVSKILPGDRVEEVAAIGAVRVDARSGVFLRRVRAVERFRGGFVTEAGRIGDPPELSDFAGVELPAEDVSALRGCRPGSCDVKLSARAMRRFGEVSWGSSDHEAAANATMRQVLLEYASAYRDGGDAELGAYHDEDDPVRVAQVFRALLASSPYLITYAPELHRYLEEYPRRALAGVSGLMYWAREDLGLKPVISLNHVSIYRPEPTADGEIVVVWKQFYASHYFEGSLAVSAWRPDGDRAALVQLERGLADGLSGGLFSGIKRDRIEDAVRERMRRFLLYSRSYVEQ